MKMLELKKTSSQSNLFVLSKKVPLISTQTWSLSQLIVGSNLKASFFNRFKSTRRMVSVLELTSTKQWTDKPIVNYISRWRSLSLDCTDKISEIFVVAMCIQGMHWGLFYILFSKN